MPITIESRFSFRLPEVTDVLLQFEAAAISEQQVLRHETTLTPPLECARVPAQDGIGERMWISAAGKVDIDYRAEVDVARQVEDMATLASLPPHSLPGEVVPYLFDSRFCSADRLQSFVIEQFGNTAGGARIAAIRDWISRELTYSAGSSGPHTTATDTLVDRRGICRDFAHVMIALARASTIPARYVACYAPGVDPPDFHAVAEVFLANPDDAGGGTWQLVDATGMANPAQTVKIGVGRDAADVSFLTSFGASEFLEHEVKVRAH